MPINYSKYVLSILLFVIIITAQSGIAQIPVNSSGNPQVPPQKTFAENSTSRKIFLSDPWEILLDNKDHFDNISIPFFVKDKSVRTATFKTYFSIPEIQENSTIRLWILGLNGSAIIKVNENLLTEHANISTSFKIELNKNLLKEKNNVLEIKLTAQQPGNAITFLQYPVLFKQFRPLGISREIYLEILPDSYFDDVSINFINKKLIITYKSIIKMDFQTRDKSIRIEEKIVAPNGNIVHKRFEYIYYQSADKSFRREININRPDLWNIDTPSRYKLHLSFKTSTSTAFELQKIFGLRTLRVKNNQIYLNGAAIEIKGINYRAVYENSFDHTFLNSLHSDFIKIKELGFNTIRFANYIPHPYAATLADSLGLLLFIDNGFWRLPESYFNDNRIFQVAKSTLTEILSVFGNNPSVVAVGLGHEIPLDSPGARKFIIILEKYLKDRFNILSYISPISFNFKSESKITDIYLLFNYQDPLHLFSQVKVRRGITSTCLLPGNVGYPCIRSDQDSISIDDYRRQYQKFADFFAEYSSTSLFKGFFVESYKDWEGIVPSPVAHYEPPNMIIYPYGIFDVQNHSRLNYQFLIKYLNNEKIENLYHFSSHRNNFFSITIFISAIIFFFFYRRSYRFRENFKRSLQHPYGFFVDLRDRRIMSIFNSTIMGLTMAVIVSGYMASVLFAFKDNLWLDEFVSIFLSDIEIKSYYLSVIQSPWKLFLCMLLLVFGIQLALSVVLRIAGFFSKETIKLRQTYAITSWTGSHVLFFIPVSIFSYNLALADILFPELLWVFILFFIWHHYRFSNGMRVLFQVKMVKMVFFIILTYLLLLVSFFIILNSYFHSIDYLDILFRARDLYYY